MRRVAILLLFAVSAVLSTTLSAQPPRTERPRKQSANSSPAGIAWYGAWKPGLAEAKKSGRPILLIAAAPHCHGISGIW